MTSGITNDNANRSVVRKGTSSRDGSVRRKKQHRRLLYGLLSFGALLLVLVASASWLIYRAEQVKTSLTSSGSLVAQLQSEFLSGDANSARTTFTVLQEQTTIARDASTDPLWRAAGLLPILGDNFTAVTAVAVSADDVVDRAIAPLLSDLESFDWDLLAPVDGRIELTRLEEISPGLSSAAVTVELPHQRLSNIDRSNLISEVSAPLAEATDALARSKDALNDAAAATTLLPAMLGNEAPRNYLILIQNSAEIRATGGIPGALAVVRADEGKIDLTAQGNATDLGRFDPAVSVDSNQASIFSTRIGRFMQSVNLTPDFPTAALTAAEMWQSRNEGTSIDGVVALDPVALSHLLKATGPVELSFEDPIMAEALATSGLPATLTSDNVVRTVLSDVYATIEEPELQDSYFAAVAAEVFDALASGKGDWSGVVQSLTRSAGEGRLYVWSNQQGEQETLASTGLAGGVTGVGTGGAAFGAYFNDGTGAKMDYYVRRTVQLHRSCTVDGYLQYTLMATLTNTAPADAATSLPAYVTGGGIFGVPAGTVQTNFVGYGPNQSQLQTARIDNESVPLGSHHHGDRPVGTLTTSLSPGQSTTIEMDFTNVVQTSEPFVDVTPTIQPISEVILPLQGDPTCGR